MKIVFGRKYRKLRSFVYLLPLGCEIVLFSLYWMQLLDVLLTWEFKWLKTLSATLCRLPLLGVTQELPPTISRKRSNWPTLTIIFVDEVCIFRIESLLQEQLKNFVPFSSRHLRWITPKCKYVYIFCIFSDWCKWIVLYQIWCNVMKNFVIIIHYITPNLVFLF